MIVKKDEEQTDQPQIRLSRMTPAEEVKDAESIAIAARSGYK
jgi:hypothetical protein